MPLITVLLCVYNGRDALVASIESILCQTYTDFEFLIVDDGSDDGSEILLQQYADRDQRIRLVRQKNTGLTTALNVGLRQAAGKYVARQDADDLSSPQRLEKQLLFMEAHPEVVLSGTDYAVIDDNDELLVEVRNSGRRNLRKAMLKSNQFIHGSMMFRRVINGIPVCFDPFYRKAQDYDLALRMMEAGEIAFVPHVLYKWRLSRHGILASNVNVYGERALTNYILRARGEGEDKSKPDTAQTRSRPSNWGYAIARGDRLMSGYRTVAARQSFREAVADPSMPGDKRRYCRKRIVISWLPRAVLRAVREIL